jgi:hypothetical protein
MMAELPFVQVCGLALLISLPVLGLTLLSGILAVKYNWSLKLALGLPLSIAMFAVFFVLWRMERQTWILVFGFIIGFISLFSHYFFPPMVIDNLNVLFARLAHTKTQKEQK